MLFATGLVQWLAQWLRSRPVPDVMRSQQFRPSLIACSHVVARWMGVAAVCGTTRERRLSGSRDWNLSTRPRGAAASVRYRRAWFRSSFSRVLSFLVGGSVWREILIAAACREIIVLLAGVMCVLLIAFEERKNSAALLSVLAGGVGDVKREHCVVGGECFVVWLGVR